MSEFGGLGQHEKTDPSMHFNYSLVLVSATLLQLAFLGEDDHEFPMMGEIPIRTTKCKKKKKRVRTQVHHWITVVHRA